MAGKRGAPKGHKKSGGRKKGASNKATKEIKDLAQVYAPAALKELARLMLEAESEAARVAAIKEILDRAYGKSPQAIVGDPNQPIHHAHSFGWMTKEQAVARGWA